MKDLIKIEVNENQEPVVNGRELHEALGVQTRYNDWFNRICEYGFCEGIDFCSILSKSTGGRPETNHAIKLDMAKEIAMIQRNEKGREVRQYFIQVEKDFNSPEKIMARALMLADKKIKTLLEDNNKKEQLIGELQPKADYTDRILKCDDLTKINVIACDYGFSAVEFNKLLKKFGIQYKQGQDWLLYSNYRGQGYTQTKAFDFIHKDGAKGSRPTMMWTQKGRLFLYSFLKEKGIYPRMEEKKEDEFSALERKRGEK